MVNKIAHILAADRGRHKGGLRHIDPVTSCSRTILARLLLAARRGVFSRLEYMIHFDLKQPFGENSRRRFGVFRPNDLPQVVGCTEIYATGAGCPERLWP